MQSSKSYTKDSGDFIRKIKDIHYIPILVTADVVGVCPSVPHTAGLKAFKNILHIHTHTHMYVCMY